MTVLSVLLFSCTPKATVSEQSLSMTTYAFDDPDPVPHPESPYYPYFAFDGYVREGREREWKTVVLENDYIRVTIIPSIGGKVWSAVEKKTGRDFLYNNHVVKFRNISMRGPWTSGGIEFNFGGIIGHQPTCATPVDYCTRQNADGSASCFIGTYDLVTCSRWQVEINLAPDAACFTTRTIWQNTTPIVRPYYHWMNAAYCAADDLELYFPGQYYIGHEGDAHAWPVDSAGRDLSKYAQNNFGADKSYHVLGNYNDFYGAYYKKDGFGSVHYSPFNEKLGMKVWIWSLSRRGAIWKDLLTDADSQYVELQSGRLYNQALPGSLYTPFKEKAFEPFAADTWTEYWYPVIETGGIAKANAYGALNITKNGKEVQIRFSPVRKISDDLVVSANGKEIFCQRLKLGVLQAWQTSIPLNDATALLKVILGDRLLEYSEQPEDNYLARPVATPAAFNRNSAYGLYLQGEQEMYANRLTSADSLLQLSLALEPYAIPALYDRASICYRQGRYAEADSLAQIILSVNAYDPGGNMLYGLANSALGRSIDAMDGFSVAALSVSYRSAANACLAKESAKTGNWKQALDYAGKSLFYAGNNTESLQLKALALRKTGNGKAAAAVTADMEKVLPLNHYARFENYLRSHSEKDRKTFLKYVRHELPHETFMEMATWYESAGCPDEALTLYNFAGKYPLALYSAAYLLFQKGDECYKSMLAEADDMPVAGVFPFRAESLPALEWTVKQSPAWKSKYYLGILYISLGQTAKGAALLEQCSEQPDEATFYLVRAQYRAGKAQEADLLAAESKGDSWRGGLALIKHYEQAKDYAGMYAATCKYAEKYPANDIIGLRYAASMLHLKKYRDCTDYLAALHILPYEHSSEGREIYRQAWLGLAKESIRAKDYKTALEQIAAARLYPENLGVGKPYDEDIDSREEDALQKQIQNVNQLNP